MTMKQHCSIFLPHYKLSQILQKKNLYEYCMNHNVIKNYLPDEIKLEYCEREFLLSVSS